jgi:hypothetical protein
MPDDLGREWARKWQKGVRKEREAAYYFGDVALELAPPGTDDDEVRRRIESWRFTGNAITGEDEGPDVERILDLRRIVEWFPDAAYRKGLSETAAKALMREAADPEEARHVVARLASKHPSRLVTEAAVREHFATPQSRRAKQEAEREQRLANLDAADQLVFRDRRKRGVDELSPDEQYLRADIDLERAVLAVEALAEDSEAEPTKHTREQYLARWAAIGERLVALAEKAGAVA